MYKWVKFHIFGSQRNYKYKNMELIIIENKEKDQFEVYREVKKVSDRLKINYRSLLYHLNTYGKYENDTYIVQKASYVDIKCTIRNKNLPKFG